MTELPKESFGILASCTIMYDKEWKSLNATIGASIAAPELSGAKAVERRLLASQKETENQALWGRDTPNLFGTQRVRTKRLSGNWGFFRRGMTLTGHSGIRLHGMGPMGFQTIPR